MPALPTKILSSVFSDGELTNEIKWYNRIFTVINQIIDYLAQDTGWLPITVNGSYVGNSPQARMKRGQIMMRGSFANNGMTTANTAYSSVGSLPAGVSPPTVNLLFSGASSIAAANCVVIVFTNGNIDIRTSDTLGAYYQLCDVTYWND